MRVVSLIPSATEIVGALGALEHLVGVTHACDWPPVVASRARVTTSAVDATRNAGYIDARVRELSVAGTPLYALKERLIRDLHPDVMLTQGLCDVCAVNENDVRALAASLSSPPRIVTLNATTLDEVFGDISRVGEAIGASDEAEELLDGLRARLDAVHRTLKAAQAPRPRVALVEWTDPLYTGGHWIPEMIHRAGGEDVIGTPGARSRAMSVDELRDSQPEVLIIAPCGYGLSRAVAEARALLAHDQWAWARDLTVWAIDANAFASRPGPRLVDGVEIFARIFNAALFSAVDSSRAMRA